MSETPERKIPRGKPSCRWMNNNKIDLGEMELGGLEWTDLARDWNQWTVLMITVMNLQVHIMLRSS
jgi:hypothetical protein